MAVVNPRHFLNSGQERILSCPRNGTGPLATGPVSILIKEACGIERLAPERWGLIPYAHAFNRQWSLQACSFVFPGGGLVDPLLRASNEALPRARVPRAGGRPGRLSLLLQSAVDGCRERRWSERAYVSSVLIGEAQTGRTISTAPSAGILPNVEPSFRFTPSSRMIDPR